MNNHIKQMKVMNEKEEILKGENELIKLLKDTITYLDAKFEHRTKKIDKEDNTLQNMQHKAQDTN